MKRLNKTIVERGFHTIIILAAITAFFTAGCATAPTEKVESIKVEKALVWPAAPSTPVIKFLHSFNSELDLGLEKKKKDWKSAMLGEDQNDKIRSLLTPYDVSVDKEGRVMVSDTNRGLQVYDFENKKFLESNPLEGSVLNKAISVASGNSGKIYVSDGTAKKVFIFNQDTSYVSALGSDEEFEKPTGIAIDDQRELIYVSDTAKHHIKVFNFEGQRVSIIGKRGNLEGEFNYPTMMALDSTGRLCVVDSMNFRIQIFTPDNDAVMVISQQGTRFGDLARPKGIAIDSSDNIYVSDAAFGNIQLWNKDGDYLMYFGAGGSASGHFFLPAGMTFDSQDRLYVADMGNKRIQVFQYLGDPGYAPSDIQNQ